MLPRFTTLIHEYRKSILSELDLSGTLSEHENRSFPVEMTTPVLWGFYMIEMEIKLTNSRGPTCVRPRVYDLLS
jgi:hypothetical protein